jgi:hypothetical protein
MLAFQSEDTNGFVAALKSCSMLAMIHTIHDMKTRSFAFHSLVRTPQ